MRYAAWIILVAAVAVRSVAIATTAAPAVQTGGASHTVTKGDIERWKKELSNWGRWGKDDQIGALNLITAAKRKHAAALVKEGFTVSLAHDALTEKAIDNPQPYEHVMQGLGSDRFGVS